MNSRIIDTVRAVKARAKRRADDPYRMLFQAQLQDRLGLIRAGVKATDAKHWLDMPTLAALSLLKALDLPVATFNRKVKAGAKLSKAESERVVGFARLVGQLETLLDDADDSRDFDARSWIARWLTEPLPALGNAKPIDYIDTMEGQSLVSQKLAQVASGAYA